MHPLFEFIVTVFYALIFLWIIGRLNFFKKSGLSINFLYIAFLVKIFAGTLLIIIYTYYYQDRSTADVFKYFDDSYHIYKTLYNRPLDFFQMLFGINNDNDYFNQYYVEMNNWFRKKENVVYNDSHTIIRFNALVRIFSFGIIHVHTVVVCFLSLCGLTAIYNIFKKYLNKRKTLFAFILFYMPSILFWCSGVLKEGLLIFALGMLLYYLKTIYEKKITLFNIAGLLFCLLLLFYLKIYVISAVIPAAIAFVWVVYSGQKYIYYKYIAVTLFFVLLVLFFKYILPVYDVPKILFEKQRDFINLSEYMNAGSIIYVYPLDGSLISFIAATPVALFNAILRPLPFELLSPLQVIASLEAIIIFLLIIVCFYKPEKRAGVALNWIYASTLFVLIVFLLIGYVTPVSGAIVRYRVPAMPFLFFTLLMLINNNFIRYIELIIKQVPIIKQIYRL